MDGEDKISHLNDGLKLLDKKIPLKSYYNEEKMKSWSKALHNEKANLCELKALFVSGIEQKINLLMQSTVWFSKARNARSFQTEILASYYELIIMIKQNNSLEQISKFASVLVKDMTEFNKSNNLYSALFDLIISTSYIGSKDESSYKYLFDRTMKDTSVESIIPDRQDYAKLVLSYNYLADFIDDDLFLIDGIKKFLTDGIAKIELALKGQQTPEDPLLDKILSEEDDNLEFKGSWGMNVYMFLDDGKCELQDDRKFDVTKAICGMLNASGGEIILGILEVSKFNIDRINKLQEIGAEFIGDKILFGIGHELKSSEKDFDSIQLQMNSHFLTNFGHEVSPNIKTGIIEIHKKEFISIQVKESYTEGGVWITTPKGEVKFYLRENGSTLPKPPDTAVIYINNRLSTRQVTEIELLD